MSNDDRKLVANLGDVGFVTYGGFFVFTDVHGKAQVEDLHVEQLDFADLPSDDSETLNGMLQKMVDAMKMIWHETFTLDLDEEDSNDLKEMLEDHFQHKLSLFTIHRFDIPQCTFLAGVLSDNEHHPGQPAWFANSVFGVCKTVDKTEKLFIEQICSPDPQTRAYAYQDLTHCFSLSNFDSQPEKLYSNREIELRYANCP